MLVSDVFPNISLNSSGDTELRTAISEVFTTMGYQTNKRQVMKNEKFKTFTFFLYKLYDFVSLYRLKNVLN